MVFGLVFAPDRNLSRNPSERETKNSGRANPASNSDKPVDQLDISALRRENERLRLRLEQLEGKTPTEGDLKSGDSQLAQDIFDSMSDPEFNNMKDKKRWMETMGNLAKLKPGMASFFIEKYKSATAPTARTIGLQLAIACGGPDATAFLKDMFGNPAVSAQDRSFAAIALTSDALVGRPNQLPVDSELWSIAEKNRTSSEFIDRLSAVGIFGMRESVESRTALIAFCTQDPVVHVRISALRALARIADRQTYDHLLGSGVAILESLPPQPPGPQGHVQQSPEVRLRQAFDQTLKDLKERFPN